MTNPHELCEATIAEQAKALASREHYCVELENRCERQLEEIERLCGIVDAIDFLRDREMSGVDICHDNSWRFGGPNTVIEVWGDWVCSTDYNRKRRFAGENLADCLRQAVEAKRAAEAAKAETKKPECPNTK